MLYAAIMWTTIGIIVSNHLILDLCAEYLQIRCIYRVIEFSQGYRGYIPTHEVFFYTLDSLPLFLAIIVWVFVWPSLYLEGGPMRGQSVQNVGMTPMSSK